MRWAELWRAGLTGDRAVTWFGALIGLAGLLLSSLAYNLPAEFLARPRVSLLEIGLATLAAAVTLLIGWWTLRTFEQPYPISVVCAIFAIVGVVRWLVLSLLPDVGPANLLGALGGLAMSVLVTIFWLSLPAAALAGYDRHLHSAASLRAERRRLERDRRLMRDRLEQDQRQVQHEVVDAVGGRLTELEQQLSVVDSASAEGMAILADELYRMSEQTVRPLSHAIAAVPGTTGPDPGPVSASLPEERALPRQLLRSATAVRPFPVLATVAVVGALALPGVVHLFGWLRGGAGFLVGSAAVTLVLGLADRLLTIPLRRLDWRLRLLLVGAIYLLAGMAMASSVVVLRPGAESALLLFWAGCFIAIVLVGTVMATVAAIAHDWQNAEADLQAAVATRSWEIQRLHTDRAALRQRASQLLHGRVQGALSAASLRLRLAADPGIETKDRVAAVADARTAVTMCGEAIATVHQRVPDTDPQESVVTGLGDVAAVWRGGVDVQVDISAEVVRRVDAVTSRSAAVVEVVREAVTNAARHGHAGSVAVTVTVDAHEVVVTAQDDGLGCADQSTGGTGLQQLAELGRLQLAAQAGGCCLTVTIPAA